MRRRAAWPVIIAGWLALAGAASGYYHFVHYQTRIGPFAPIPEKFDLNALLDSTVPYLISEQGPTQLAQNDSVAGVVSQIQLAAKAWNEVATSRLRLSFGGFASADAQQTGPGIDILFDEVPPGLVALGGPTVRADAIGAGAQAFVPIVRSVVILRRDLSQRPSFSEGFFLTMVHEIGHALGLQHTLTSGVMSTEITRATTKTQPLSTDDIAGISLLYPTPAFQASTGSIAGRAVVDGEAASMASVVAISPDGPAVSAIANPDGTYRIDGIPPGGYFVYIHPLPPPLAGEVTPANMILPLDGDGRSLAPGPNFSTQFYPGAREFTAARSVQVTPGSLVDNINFALARRDPPSVYAVQTYSFPARVAVKPAHLNLNAPGQFMVATGVGLTSGAQPAPNMNASVIGSAAFIPQGGLRAYPMDGRYVQIDFQFTPFASEGQRHMLFSTPSDVYVLPSAFRLVRRPPPSITAALASRDSAGRLVLQVEGTNLSSQTKILLDGVAATLRGADESGRLLVELPPAPGGHRATVVALNPDGQSSLFAQGNNVPVVDYEFVEEPSIGLSLASLPPGAEAVVEVGGLNTDFAAGRTQLAFGTSDVQVRRLWVAGPNRLVANVVVSPSAALVPGTVSVINGLQIINLPFGFRPQASAPALHFRAPAVEALSGRQEIQPGAMAQIRVAGAPQDAPASQVQVSVNDQPALSQGISGGVLTFQVPQGLAPGPGILRMIVGGQLALPIGISIDLPPPSIVAILSGSANIDVSRPARPGELLTLLVTNLTEPGAAAIPSQLRIRVGQNEFAPTQMTPYAAVPGAYLVQFLLNALLPPGVHPITITYDGRVSAALSLNVRAQ